MCSGIATYFSCMIIQQGCMGYYVKTERLGLMQLDFLDGAHDQHKLCLDCIQHLRYVAICGHCNVVST